MQSATPCPKVTNRNYANLSLLLNGLALDGLARGMVCSTGQNFSLLNTWVSFVAHPFPESTFLNPPLNTMTRWRENKDKRGVKATKYVFTTEQEKILYDYGWDLEQNINTIAKGRSLKNNTHVTAWKKKNTSAIMALPEFESLDLSEHSQVNWVTVSDLALTHAHRLNVKTGYYYVVDQLLQPLCY